MDLLKTRKIILLGKQRVGKSSLANIILGEPVFEINHSSESSPYECEPETRFANGKRITVTDTPGFFDPRRPEEELQPGIVLCIQYCAYGSDAILIVLKVENFTKQEKDLIEEMFQNFPGDAFKYAAVVFTHGEQLPRGMTIEEFVSQNKHLRNLVRKCDGRCHVVDSIYWEYSQRYEYRTNQFQVQQLLSTIDKMVRKNKRCYNTNEMRDETDEEEDAMMQIPPTFMQDLEVILRGRTTARESEIRAVGNMPQGDTGASPAVADLQVPAAVDHALEKLKAILSLTLEVNLVLLMAIIFIVALVVWQGVFCDDDCVPSDSGPPDDPSSNDPDAEEEANAANAARGILKAALFLLGAVGALVWLKQNIHKLINFLKSLPRHIVMILLVVVFYSMLLLSFCIRVPMFGNLIVLILLLLFVLLLLLL